MSGLRGKAAVFGKARIRRLLMGWTFALLGLEHRPGHSNQAPNNQTQQHAVYGTTSRRQEIFVVNITARRPLAYGRLFALPLAERLVLPC